MLDDLAWTCKHSQGILVPMSIHKTIKAERESRGWSMETLAKKVAEEEGLSKPLSWQSVQQWEKEGGTAPKRKRLEAVAKIFGMAVSALLGEEAEESTPDFIAVSHLSVEVGAGPGRINDVVEEVGTLQFRRDFLRSFGVSPKHSAVVNVVGTSMEPTIHDGAVLLLNRAEKEPRAGSIYAFAWGDEMLVKRFQKVAGVWHAVSDNADKDAHPDIIINGHSEALIQGRAIWMGVKL